MAETIIPLLYPLFCPASVIVFGLEETLVIYSITILS